MASPFTKVKDDTEKKQHDSLLQDKVFRVKATLFLAGVTGFSMLFGFGATLALAKRRDPNYFTRGLTSSKELPESGGSLALRALGWGSLYSFTGFSIFCYGIWKLLGVKNLEEFRHKMGKTLPVIPKNDPPQGRTEFKNLTDLLQHIIDEDERQKTQTKDAKSQE